ncbi:MAG: thioredoxin [Chitinivibrionales bacterium]|nr:thioredoxin [Chitinivibrionales bacterium]
MSRSFNGSPLFHVFFPRNNYCTKGNTMQIDTINKHSKALSATNAGILVFLVCALWGASPVSAQVQKAPTDSSQQIADRIVNSKVPVLIDFWAPWCMPCKMLNPIIKKLEKKYTGKIEVIKVNTDIHRGLAAYFGISGIPAVFLVKDKAVVKALPGLQPEEKYDQAIQELLQKTAANKGQDNSKSQPDSSKKQ